MKTYVTSASVDNTPIERAFIFVDDTIASGRYPTGGSEDGFGFDSAADILYFFDDCFTSTTWRKAPQACYNGGATQMGLEYLSALIEQYWDGMVSFNRLDTVYHESTTLAEDATIAGNEVTISSSVSVSTSTEYVSILSDSPFDYTIMASGQANTMQFSFYVIPSEALVDGKLNFTTNMEVSVITCRIWIGASNGWQCNSYISGHWNVPQKWINDLNGKNIEPAPEDDDPYTGPDGTDEPSVPGGGSGDGMDNYDPGSDPNPVPSLPGLSAVDTGFITLFNPTLYQLRELASYMWGSLFDIDNYKKLFADPMECILGLSIVPVDVPAGSATTVKVGNISTGISMTRASSQYVSVNCGTIEIKEKWKAYLDYSPYTKISIFLPFIGSHELDIDLIVGNTLGVVYHIDVLSGGCVAFVTVNGNVRYEFPGQCSMSIPITSRDFTQTLMALGQMAASAIGAVATGGLSAPVSAATIAGSATAAANTANNVISNKPRIEKSGNLGGSNAIIGSRKPYIIIERPRLCAPAEQNRFTGYPSYITYTLSELSGFTQMQNIHLNIDCTDSERDEIMTLLREGVIL